MAPSAGHLRRCRTSAQQSSGCTATALGKRTIREKSETGDGAPMSEKVGLNGRLVSVNSIRYLNAHLVGAVERYRFQSSSQFPIGISATNVVSVPFLRTRSSARTARDK